MTLIQSYNDICSAHAPRTVTNEHDEYSWCIISYCYCKKGRWGDFRLFLCHHSLVFLVWCFVVLVTLSQTHVLSTVTLGGAEYSAVLKWSVILGSSGWAWHTVRALPHEEQGRPGGHLPSPWCPVQGQWGGHSWAHTSDTRWASALDTSHIKWASVHLLHKVSLCSVHLSHKVSLCSVHLSYKVSLCSVHLWHKVAWRSHLCSVHLWN